MPRHGIYGTPLMSKPLSFVAIFKTHFVANEIAKIVSQPVKIEIFRGVKSYEIPVQSAYKFPENKERTLAVVEPLHLDDGHYIEIKVRTKIKNVDEARAFCEAEVDRTISMLVSIFNLHLFDSLVYKGWLVENDWGVLGGWIQIVDEPAFQINSNKVEDDFLKFHRHLQENDDWFDRFTLMSRFLVKALTYTNGEEKFLLLWTALEVFPMKDTSNIEPISLYLGKILSRDAASVKEKLGVGQLYGLRSSLVHDGKFSVKIINSFARNETESERQFKYRQSDTIARLEYILREIMRFMCGLPYSGSLDRYL